MEDSEFVRRDDERVRVFPVSGSGLIVILLPAKTDIAELRYQLTDQGQRVLTDDGVCSIEISEFSARRYSDCYFKV